MKLTKWLTPILISTLTVTGVGVGLVGCGDGQKPTPPEPPSPPIPEEIEKFISDRTFSLQGIAYLSKKGQHYLGARCFGTGWIIDDATPQIANDYKYHVATNWHVTQGFNDLYLNTPEGYTFEGLIHAYADNTSVSSPSGILDANNDYTFLEADAYQEETETSTFLYSPPENKKGIDLYEADIDFADTLESTPFSTAIQAKLDYLNSYRANHGYINQFAIGDDPITMQKTKYIGGYPMKESGDLFGGKWETHEVNSELNYVSSHQHTINSEDGSKTVDDISPQYDSELNMGDNWMTGGASGSMLITEDCKICGIYWGGWKSSQTSTDFYPSFSLFNTFNKNFLYKYIHTEE